MDALKNFEDKDAKLEDIKKAHDELSELIQKVGAAVIGHRRPGRRRRGRRPGRSGRFRRGPDRPQRRPDVKVYEKGKKPGDESGKGPDDAVEGEVVK